ncbi:hypothetical protein D3C77_681820 [compost metagenome]
MVVAQGVGERFVDHPFFQGLVVDRERNFHPAEEVSVHPVGRRQIDRFLAFRIEIEHPRMLQEAAHDGPHADVLRQA